MAQKLVKKHGFAKKSGVQGYLYQFYIIVITNLPSPLSRYSKFLNQSIHHSMIIDLVIIRCKITSDLVIIRRKNFDYPPQFSTRASF